MAADRAPHVAIVGAGPCGLSCGNELASLGHDDWAIYERHDAAGGHAASVVDGRGFTWDLGGHVVFSHYGEFDRLFDEVMGDDVHEHERSSYVRVDGRWVPYPFQNNLRYLDRESAYECLAGLIEAPGADRETDFGTWLERTFGEGITRLFMRPYNEKVWTIPLERMSASWIAERVSVPDRRRALRSVLLELDDVGWGPNNLFRFPSSGGTGEIYRRVAAGLAPRVHFGYELVSLDPRGRELVFANGDCRGYEVLVSTMPIDRLVLALAECPSNVREAARRLEHNSVWIVGLGVERGLSDERSWLYISDPRTPVYRVTNFAKYAAANVPDGDTTRYSSYLTESAFSRHRPLVRGGLEEQVLTTLVDSELLAGDEAIVSAHAVEIEYAYPIPTLDRDEALAVIQRWLAEQGIYSRGRFGAWRYEIGNMDHAVKMGVDAARRILEGRHEELWAA